MRTRRRPVLQDKTPVNTPQKPRAAAKPKLVPVVEIKSRLRRVAKGTQEEDAHQPSVNAEDSEERVLEPQPTRASAGVARSPQTKTARLNATAGRERARKAGGIVKKRTGRQPASRKEGDQGPVFEDYDEGHSNALTTPAPEEGPTQVAGRKRTRAQAAQSEGRLEPRVATRRLENLREPANTDSHNPRQSAAPASKRRRTDAEGPPPVSVEHAPVDPPRRPKVRRITDVIPESPGSESAAADVSPTIQSSRAPLRHISPPASPTASRQPLAPHPREPLHPTTVPSPQRDSTPDTIPIADEDSSPSDAVKAIFDTPSPARIIRAPIPAHSTPMGGRLEQQFSPLPPMPMRGRHASSIRRWNHGVRRDYSPLPPSSPPPPTPPTQEPIAGSSRVQPLSQPQPEEDDDMENEPPRGPTYVRQERSSDDDPFGILAAERKVKALRQQRAMAESSRAPGVPRAPLGTLALDEVPSSDVHIPEHLPTPLPSDDDHNIDDLYLDVDPMPARMVLDEEYEDEEDEDKENIPTADYDLNEDKENLRPPVSFKDKDSELDLPLEGDEDAENGPLPLLGETGDPPIPPLLAASAKKDLTDLFQPSSSSASPTHALRTPHKHRSAHKRTPLPTPNFSDEGFSDSPLTAKSVGRRDSSPSPIKPSVAARARAGPSVVRKPLAPIEVEAAPEEEPPKVAGQKRTRAQAVQSESDSDPRAAVRRLENLLPKRSKTRTASTTARGTAAKRGRGRPAATKGKGKGRAVPAESASEDDTESNAEEDNDTSPPKAKKAKTTRGTGRGRGTSRGRARGRSAAPVSASGRPASKRGRSTSKGKGKERAEEIDPGEDEERARKRQERLEYFRQLQEYSIEKEDVYVI